MAVKAVGPAETTVAQLLKRSDTRIADLVLLQVRARDGEDITEGLLELAGKVEALDKNLTILKTGLQSLKDKAHKPNGVVSPETTKATDVVHGELNGTGLRFTAATAPSEPALSLPETHRKACTLEFLERFCFNPTTTPNVEEILKSGKVVEETFLSDKRIAIKDESALRKEFRLESVKVNWDANVSPAAEVTLGVTPPRAGGTPTGMVVFNKFLNWLEKEQPMGAIIQADNGQTFALTRYTKDGATRIGYFCVDSSEKSILQEFTTPLGALEFLVANHGVKPGGEKTNFTISFMQKAHNPDAPPLLSYTDNGLKDWPATSSNTASRACALWHIDSVLHSKEFDVVGVLRSGKKIAEAFLADKSLAGKKADEQEYIFWTNFTLGAACVKIDGFSSPLFTYDIVSAKREFFEETLNLLVSEKSPRGVTLTLQNGPTFALTRSSTKIGYFNVNSRKGDALLAEFTKVEDAIEFLVEHHEGQDLTLYYVEKNPPRPRRAASPEPAPVAPAAPVTAAAAPEVAPHPTLDVPEDITRLIAVKGKPVDEIVAALSQLTQSFNAPITGYENTTLCKLVYFHLSLIQTKDPTVDAADQAKKYDVVKAFQGIGDYPASLEDRTEAIERALTEAVLAGMKEQLSAGDFPAQSFLQSLDKMGICNTFDTWMATYRPAETGTSSLSTLEKGRWAYILGGKGTPTQRESSKVALEKTIVQLQTDLRDYWLK